MHSIGQTIQFIAKTTSMGSVREAQDDALDGVVLCPVVSKVLANVT